jgi:hypothetical protein
MPVRAETQATPEPIEHEQAKHTTQEIGEGVKNGVKKTSKHCGTLLLISARAIQQRPRARIAARSPKRCVQRRTFVSPSRAANNVNAAAGDMKSICLPVMAITLPSI